MCWRATRKGPSRLAVAFALPLAPASPGHALTGPSTARHSSSSGRHLVCPDALEFALLVENRPGDAGKLVGERDRQHIVVQTFFGSLDPGLEPIAVPMLWPDPRADRRSWWRRTSSSDVAPLRRSPPHRGSHSSVLCC